MPGWRSIGLDGRKLRLPAGIRLDFGATAKGLGADWAASAAATVGRTRWGAGEPGRRHPRRWRGTVGGWPVLIADEHRQATRAGSPTQVVRLPGGAIATSSTTCRRWRRAGTLLHHIVDPRTGRPAAGPWRTVSVAAATCAEANAAATGAIISGADAAGWLTSRKLPGRLVGRRRNRADVGRLAGHRWRFDRRATASDACG